MVETNRWTVEQDYRGSPNTGKWFTLVYSLHQEHVIVMNTVTQRGQHEPPCHNRRREHLVYDVSLVPHPVPVPDEETTVHVRYRNCIRPQGLY